MILHAALLAICALSSLTSASLTAAKRDALTDCLAEARVPFDAKGSETWAQNIKPYNLRLPYTPAAIAIPTCPSQIQAAVACGIKHNVRISAKGGGHGYASFAYGGEDGHLVIILDRMYQVTLDNSGKAKVQPGARLGHVATELYRQGKRAIAHGSCPGVGVAGHVLHGGYGFASRTYGLTLDWLIGATVVLANATTVHCSNTENADLFWAIRGAGSSFGIVAEFEFMTFEAPVQVTPFRIDLSWNEEEAVEGIKALQQIAITADDELNMQIYLGTGGQRVQGVFYGDRDGLNTTLAPFLQDIDAEISKASTMGWIESLEYYTNGQPLDQTYPYVAHETFYTTNLMTKALSDKQITSFIRALFKNILDPSARHSWYILLDLHGGPNSVVNSMSSPSTSYVHRDKLFLFQLSDGGSDGSYPEEGFSLLKGFRESITDLMGDDDWGMYANYLDSQLDGETAQKLYWGDNLGRLKSIKAEVDPDDVFWNPQGVRPV